MCSVAHRDYTSYRKQVKPRYVCMLHPSWCGLSFIKAAKSALKKKKRKSFGLSVSVSLRDDDNFEKSAKTCRFRVKRTFENDLTRFTPSELIPHAY